MPMANPMHWEATDPDVLWSPGNVSEAIPGVSTPLNWSFVGDAIELAGRSGFASLGVLAPGEVTLGDRAEDRFIVAFYGRTVANIEKMRLIGDRMPGASANGIEQQLFGVVRQGVENHPSYRRWPVVSARMPPAVAGLSERQRRVRAGLVEWWQGHVLHPPADAAAARALLAEARARYRDVFTLGTVASMLASALFDQISALCAQASTVGLEQRLVTGYSGMLETALVRDLWGLSRDGMDLTSFLLRHGFHGPDEGQMASRVWREDPSPVLALAERYAALPAASDPDDTERRQAEQRGAAEAELFGALGRLRAPGAKLVLRLARALIPQREIGKANYTQALDAARLAARVLGSSLAADGRLADADDVFYLTVTELLDERPAGDLNGLVKERRAIREEYLGYELPDRWTGPPVPIPVARADHNDPGGPVTGVAVGGGPVTGRVRVVLDTAEADLESGEILVCRTTDPGWVSLFHLAAGVVIDVGGQMSHGAIVARELGVPCVIGTGDGTRRLRTGDLVSLDGAAGTVQVLEPAEPVGRSLRKR
jgi:phosphohistidine swiveling domain-containing protein